MQDGFVRKVKKQPSSKRPKKVVDIKPDDRENQVAALLLQFKQNGAAKLNQNLGSKLTDELGTGLYVTAIDQAGDRLVAGILALYKPTK